MASIFPSPSVADQRLISLTNLCDTLWPAATGNESLVRLISLVPVPAVLFPEIELFSEENTHATRIERRDGFPVRPLDPRSMKTEAAQNR